MPPNNQFKPGDIVVFRDGVKLRHNVIETNPQIKGVKVTSGKLSKSKWVPQDQIILEREYLDAKEKEKQAEKQAEKEKLEYAKKLSKEGVKARMEALKENQN